MLGCMYVAKTFRLRYYGGFKVRNPLLTTFALEYTELLGSSLFRVEDFKFLCDSNIFAVLKDIVDLSLIHI